MLSRSLKSSRSTAVRVFHQHSPVTARLITTTTVRQADPVQDIYLKHLREFKPQPVKPGDAEQHVHKFATPSGFKSPEEPNLASELNAYQSQAVEVEGQAEQLTTETPEQQQDWFEQFEDFEAEDRAASGGH